MPSDLPFETSVVARLREVSFQRGAGTGLADCNQEPRLAFELLVQAPSFA